MHNGTISHFKKVQQRIISSLHVDVFSLCEGTSDSWYLFLIFLQKLYELKNSTDFLNMEVSVEEMGWAVKQVLEMIHEIMLEAGITDPSSLNVTFNFVFLKPYQINTFLHISVSPLINIFLNKSPQTFRCNVLDFNVF